jgi:hypothetical protein
MFGCTSKIMLFRTNHLNLTEVHHTPASAKHLQQSRVMVVDNSIVLEGLLSRIGNLN